MFTDRDLKPCGILLPMLKLLIITSKLFSVILAVGVIFPSQTCLLGLKFRVYRISSPVIVIGTSVSGRL